jgi:hypothetical protein
VPPQGKQTLERPGKTGGNGSQALPACAYNAPMKYRRPLKILLITAMLGLVSPLLLSAQDSSHRGRKYKAPPPTSRVNITILRNEDSKPIENAAVVFQLEGDKGNMELKTNEDGKTMIDVLPTGSKVVLQVIAKGFQTYGSDYTIDKSEMAILVKLKRPGQQYSIYDNHPEAADAGKTADGKNASADANKGSATKDTKDSSSKDASKDQSSDSSGSSSTKPDNTQPQ